MATIAAGSALETAVTHVNGTPDDCSVARSRGRPTRPAAPSGGLFGSGTIVNPAIGTIYAYNADAIDWLLRCRHGQPVLGFVQRDPELTRAQTSATTAVAFNYATASSGGSNGRDLDHATANAIDAVSSVFTASSINNEYVIEAASGFWSQVDRHPSRPSASTSTVRPDRPVHQGVHDGLVLLRRGRRPVLRPRADHLPGGRLLAAADHPAVLAVLLKPEPSRSRNAADYVAGNGVGRFSGSQADHQRRPRGNGGFQSGWMSLNLDRASRARPARFADGDVFHGLPVTGFPGRELHQRQQRCARRAGQLLRPVPSPLKRNFCTNQGGACS